MDRRKRRASGAVVGSLEINLERLTHGKLLGRSTGWRECDLRAKPRVQPQAKEKACF